MKFAFRLDRLLHLRRRTEDERARSLGEAMRAEEAKRAALEAAEADLGRCAVPGTEEAVPAGALRNRELSVHAAASAVAAAEERLAAAVDIVDSEQSAYRDARKDRRAVEKLKETRKDAWGREVAREEQRDMDEIALRRRGGGGAP